MRVRGRRRCRDCGREWSYYETGEVACPDCGSLHSVAAEEERRLHTDAPVDLDLGAARAALDERSLEAAAREAGTAAREYVAARGFVDAGDLVPLDEAFLAAAELRNAALTIRESLRAGPAVEEYFLALLEGAPEGERPGDVPDALRGARGLAAVDAVRGYREDVLAWLPEGEESAARRVLERLRDHERRIAALDGEVPPAEAERLVGAMRAVGEYLRTGEEGALARARERLDRLG